MINVNYRGCDLCLFTRAVALHLLPLLEWSRFCILILIVVSNNNKSKNKNNRATGEQGNLATGQKFRGIKQGILYFIIF